MREATRRALRRADRRLYTRTGEQARTPDAFPQGIAHHEAEAGAFVQPKGPHEAEREAEWDRRSLASGDLQS